MKLAITTFNQETAEHAETHQVCCQRRSAAIVVAFFVPSCLRGCK